MPNTLESYLREGELNWAHLDCVVGEISRIWNIELGEATSKASKESIEGFELQNIPIRTEAAQSCLNFLNRANEKRVVTERDLQDQKLKEYEAQLKQKDAEIKMLKFRLDRGDKRRLDCANKLKSAYEAIKTDLE